MFDKKMFGLLLMVSVVSTAMFTAFVWAPSGPSISVYPSTGITLSADTFIKITGTGWAPNTPVVTLYWDQQNANHTVALVKPSGSGTFTVNQLEIEGMSVGPHTVIAVQGTNTATATFTVSVTAPPDDRTLDAIQQLNNVKMEAVITSPPINVTTTAPRFNISANQPWDLMAVYITTNGVKTGDSLHFGLYGFGSREYALNTQVTVAKDYDVADFPLFPGDMTNGTQSVIAVPANVSVDISFGVFTYGGLAGFTVTFKIVIQRPIDPSFSYNIAYGY